MSYGRYDRFYQPLVEPPVEEIQPPYDPGLEGAGAAAQPHNIRLNGRAGGPSRPGMSRRWGWLSRATLETTTLIQFPAPPTAALITQATVEVMTEATDTEARITQATVEVMHAATDAELEARITQATVEAMTQDEAHTVRVTQYWLEVLIPFECPTFPPSLCPGDVVDERTDGLPYSPTDPDPCTGAGDVGPPRTGQ